VSEGIVGGEMKKELSVYDATKDELIEYFFKPDCFGGGFRIPAMKDHFLSWLKGKRNRQLLDAQDVAIEDSQKHLQEYIRLIRQANDATDLDGRLEILDRADKAYQRYELAEKHYRELDKKLSESLWLEGK
jgi:hypothetical protein